MTPLTNLMNTLQQHDTTNQFSEPERPFSEANIFSPTQGYVHILRKPHVHYRVHNIQSFVFTLN